VSLPATPFDVVGVGLNATDTLIVVPRFPAYAGKAPFTREVVSAGGQVASALAVCSKLGLRTKYIGAVGDDEAGKFQLQSLRETGINLDGVEIRANCPNQRAYIIVDESTGERTIFWRRDDCLTIDPERITAENIACARLLHVDGHDTPAAAKAAQIARANGIPVSVDVDTIYPGFGEVLRSADYLVSSTEFPEKWTGESDPFRALKEIQTEYGMRVAAMTLGAYGALARAEARFFYSPGFVVNCADTTGAGDVFHGAFCYAVLAGMPLSGALEFSNAMAALNCTHLGARGGIASQTEARALMNQAAADPSVGRKSSPEFSGRGS
jgi:sulfofructose kinase